jgi:hypothetical protein
VNDISRKGEIGLAVSDDDAMTWQYQRVVLEEPFHLSYPQVFEWLGAHYMIPESSRGGGVRLYRALAFPERWTYVGTLLHGQRYADASILFHKNIWWLFVDAGLDSRRPVLRLFLSDDLFSGWQEHPSSPISHDLHTSRPAGRIIVMNDQPIRFAQDIYPVYGSRVHAFVITTLTRTEYEEHPARERAVLSAGFEAWNRGGMHHLDAHQLSDNSWIACVDGFRQPVGANRGAE